MSHLNDGILILGRHLAIGDIHGCITALTTLVDFVDARDDDVIITLGDYIDRGPNARAVVDFIIELRRRQNLVALRGNHEIMMLDAREKQSWLRPWLSYGGDATLESYGGSFDGVPAAHMEFLEKGLTPYYECETHFFVHACAETHKALEDQSEAALYWRKFGNPDRHCSGKIMVCGHTPQESGIPLSNGNAVCIDTLAYGGGWLSCLDVDSGTVWQANEAGDTRTLELDN